MVTVSAAGYRFDIEIVRGVELVFDTAEQLADGSYTTLSGNTFSLVFYKGKLNNPDTTVTRTVTPAIIASDPDFGANKALRVTLDTDDADWFVANTEYCFFCRKTPTGGDPVEFFRGQVRVLP